MYDTVLTFGYQYRQRDSSIELKKEPRYLKARYRSIAPGEIKSDERGEGRARRAASPELPSRPMLAEPVRQPPRLAEDGRRRPCARTVTFALARALSRSCQLHNGNVGSCLLVLLPPSFLSGGPAQTLDRPLRGYHESFCLSLSRTLSFFVSLSVSLSLSLARSPALTPRLREFARGETKSQRPRFGNESSEPTRRVPVDVTQQPTRSEPRRKGSGRRGRRLLRGRSQRSRSITPLDHGAARGRPSFQPTHRFRNDARRQLHEG